MIATAALSAPPLPPLPTAGTVAPGASDGRLLSPAAGGAEPAPPDVGPARANRPGGFDDAFDLADDDEGDSAPGPERGEPRATAETPTPTGEPEALTADGTIQPRWAALEYRIAAGGSADAASSSQPETSTAQAGGAAARTQDGPLALGSGVSTREDEAAAGPGKVIPRRDMQDGTGQPVAMPTAETQKGETRNPETQKAETAPAAPVLSAAGRTTAPEQPRTASDPAPEPPRAAQDLPLAREKGTDRATSPTGMALPTAEPATREGPTIGEASSLPLGDQGAEKGDGDRKGARERTSTSRADRTEAVGQAIAGAQQQAAEGRAATPTPPGVTGAIGAGMGDSGSAAGPMIATLSGAEATTETGTARSAERPAQGQATLVLRLPEGGGLTAGAARQVAEMTVAARPGGVELRFEPDELGSVRLNLVTEGETVRVTVLAERPETLDLFRRNASELAAEFRALGFGGASFSFGREGRSSEGRAAFDTADPAEAGAPVAAAPGLGNVAMRPPGRGGGPSALDIRL